MTRAIPSQHGAALGTALAALADAGRSRLGDPFPDMCATCAFREGSLPSQMAPTVLEALNCVMGVDEAGFGCHHGMSDGHPTRPCAGYAAALAAPFDTVKTVMADLKIAMDNLAEDDPVQATFLAWRHQVDPDGRMDDYQLARLWAKEGRREAA